MSLDAKALAELSLESPARIKDSREEDKSSDLNSAPKLQASSGDEADDNTCAICLNRIPQCEVAQPVGCDHIYCTCCILHWACFKEKPWCPQCKLPFSSLLTFRTLDGELHDYPCQEPITLLRCTPWFQDHVQMRERLIAAANSRPISVQTQGSIVDESDYQDYARYYQEYDDDEQVEDYYYSSAAGSARIVIGNRRHGPNGYMRSGRQQARPNPPAQPKTAKGKVQASGGTPATPKSQPNASLSAAGSSSTPTPRRGSAKKKKPSIKLDSDDESEDGRSPSSSALGRRARRSQRRAAADARGGL